MKQISLNEIDRMDGLVNTKNLQTIIDTSKSIIKDLQKDGFDKNEIVTYLWFCIDKQRMPSGTEDLREFYKQEKISPTKQAMWESDAEGMHNLMSWLLRTVANRSEIHFYETSENGVLLVGESLLPLGEVFITWERLDMMHVYDKLDTRPTMNANCSQCGINIIVIDDPARMYEPDYCSNDCQNLYESKLEKLTDVDPLRWYLVATMKKPVALVKAESILAAEMTLCENDDRFTPDDNTSFVTKEWEIPIYHQSQ